MRLREFLNDWWRLIKLIVGSLAIPVILWAGGYAACLWYFVPKVQLLSAASAEGRSMVTGPKSPRGVITSQPRSRISIPRRRFPKSPSSSAAANLRRQAASSATCWG